jgi:hypothetical protein
MDQVLSAIGAAAILFAFWALQTKRMCAEQRRYQLLNLLGGVLLATAAAITHGWAFVVLNTVWALVALWALLRPSRSASASPSPDGT